MPVTYSLLSPSPPWASITSSGLLSIGVVPDEGYIGLIRVRAIDGVLSATKDIPVNIQAKYRVVLDFVEVSDYILNAAIGGAFYESFEVQSALVYVLNPAIGGAFYEDTNYLPSTIVPLDIVVGMPIVGVLPSPTIPMSIVAGMPIVGIPTSKSLPLDIVVGMPIVGAPTTAIVPLNIVVGMPVSSSLPPAITPMNIVVDMPIAGALTAKSLPMNIIVGMPIAAVAVTSIVQIVPSYIVSTITSDVWLSPSYGNLNDNSFQTGGAINPNGSMNFDLGSTTNLSHVLVSGGSLGSPWNDAIAAYLNGAILQRSIDNITWTAITTISGVTNNPVYTQLDINASARYLRLVNTGYLATSSFIIYRFT